MCSKFNLTKRADIATMIIFIIVQIILFVLVFTTSGNIFIAASYGCVINPFAYSFKFLSKDKNIIYTQIGLLNTVLADLFLVVIHPQLQEVAMVFFSITQICYFLRLLNQVKNKKLHIILRIIYVMIVVAITAIVLKRKTDFLSVVSMFYYSNLILNVVYALAVIKKSPLFAIGLVLFLLCDTIIGINVASGAYITISEASLLYKITHLPFDLAWVFYIPSQAFIALSLHTTGDKTNNVVNV